MTTTMSMTIPTHKIVVRIEVNDCGECRTGSGICVCIEEMKLFVVVVIIS